MKPVTVSDNFSFRFLNGAISPSLISEVVSFYSVFERIGAHSVFLGQVRNDVIDEKEVYAIDYTAYDGMVDKEFVKLKEQLLQSYELTAFKVFHSKGIVKSGGISLFVLTAARHRRAAIDACSAAVDLIKKDLPIWGKELFGDGNYIWKKNRV